MATQDRRNKILFFLGLAGIGVLIYSIVPTSIYSRLLYQWVDPPGVLSALNSNDDLAERVAILETDNRQLSKVLWFIEDLVGPSFSETKKATVFAGLSTGDIAAAETVISELAANAEEEMRADPTQRCDAARANRHLGTITYLHDEGGALKALERSTLLDPLDPDGWQTLGRILLESGDLAGAERAFLRVLSLGTDITGLTLAAAAHEHVAQIGDRRSASQRAESARNEAKALRDQFANASGPDGPYRTPEMRAWLTQIESGAGQLFPNMRLEGQHGYAGALMLRALSARLQGRPATACGDSRKARALFHEVGDLEREMLAIDFVMDSCC